MVQTRKALWNVNPGHACVHSTLVCIAQWLWNMQNRFLWLVPDRAELQQHSDLWFMDHTAAHQTESS